MGALAVLVLCYANPSAAAAILITADTGLPITQFPDHVPDCHNPLISFPWFFIRFFTLFAGVWWPPCISRLQYIHNPLSMSSTQMEGFEPSGRLPGQLLSGEPHSATLPHLPERCIRTSGPDSQIHACAGLDLNQQCLPPGSRFYRPLASAICIPARVIGYLRFRWM